jgi:hypothetical protein
MTAVATAPRLPAAQAWLHPSHDRECPTCHRLIKLGTLVAHVDTLHGGAHVCANCTSTPRPA